MKLVIQIPCFNEEETIAQTLRELPTHIEGIDCIEILVINDGSTDNTVQVAKLNGAHHILSLPRNTGLSNAFHKGIKHAVRLDADIIVNTDGDNQYCGEDVGLLVSKIISNEADIVIGDRAPRKGSHYSNVKKLIHYLGTKFLSSFLKSPIPDAPSGFRAFSREFAENLFIYSNFTYTVETIIHAIDNNFRIVFVPIRVNKVTRPSRLYRNIFIYISRLLKTLFEMYFLYRPHIFFFKLAFFFFTVTFVVCVRYLLYFFFVAEEEVYIPSLILGVITSVFGAGCIVLGIICNQLRINRKLLEHLSEGQYKDNI